MDRATKISIRPLIFIVFICNIAVFSQVNAQTTVYHYYNDKGVAVFTDAKPKVSGFEVVHLKCERCENKLEQWHHTPLYTSKYHEYLDAAAKQSNVELALLKAIVHAESSFNPKAQSDKGAKGLMQLMPLLVKQFAIDDPFDPKQNINAGSAYFATLLKRFGGNSKLAAAAYNAGPSNVVHYGGVPPFAQTQAFVQRVDILRKRYRQYEAEQILKRSQFASNNDKLSEQQTGR
ncbi:lytic transglycosylase domain-containing protein [Pseudoalteromonas sp. SSDWG2]|uniref:lytic transglycosylase domain-containing protein n=1 Tax=Pseudoalteromonas sp. SSDWG2 TaxID=3139391 RepID=UPI003BA93A5C